MLELKPQLVSSLKVNNIFANKICLLPKFSDAKFQKGREGGKMLQIAA